MLIKGRTHAVHFVTLYSEKKKLKICTGGKDHTVAGIRVKRKIVSRED